MLECFDDGSGSPFTLSATSFRNVLTHAMILRSEQILKRTAHSAELHERLSLSVAFHA